MAVSALVLYYGEYSAQRDKCLNSSEFRVAADRNDCTLFKLTPRNAISYRHVSSCVDIENHLTLFKKRHLLDEFFFL